MATIDAVSRVRSTVSARRVHTVNHRVPSKGAMIAFLIQGVTQNTVAGTACEQGAGSKNGERRGSKLRTPTSAP